MFRYIKFAHLGVSDQNRALQFWRDRIGFKLEVDSDPDGNGWRWIEFSIPGAETRLLFEPAEGPVGTEAAPALVFIVEDVDRVATELMKKGVEFPQKPKPAPWNPNESYALFRDSEGNLIQISARKGA